MSLWRTSVYKVCGQCADAGHDASRCAREHVHQFVARTLADVPTCRCGMTR